MGRGFFVVMGVVLCTQSVTAPASACVVPFYGSLGPPEPYFGYEANRAGSAPTVLKAFNFYGKRFSSSGSMCSSSSCDGLRVHYMEIELIGTTAATWFRLQYHGEPPVFGERVTEIEDRVVVRTTINAEVGAEVEMAAIDEQGYESEPTTFVLEDVVNEEKEEGEGCRNTGSGMSLMWALVLAIGITRWVHSRQQMAAQSNTMQ